MVLFADIGSVNNLIFSDNEIDAEIVRGIVEGFDSGKSISETFEFEKFEITGDVSMRAKGKTLKIIVSNEAVLYLKEVLEQRKVYC